MTSQQNRRDFIVLAAGASCRRRARLAQSRPPPKSSTPSRSCRSIPPGERPVGEAAESHYENNYTGAVKP
jgi:hypothetical protein